MTPARFRWGMLLIQIGIFFILQNNDVIDGIAWENLFILFPIVLIAIGIEKIFTKSKLQFIAYATTVGLFVGGFAIVLSSSSVGFQDNNYFSDSIYKEKLDPKIRMIKAELILEENDLTIRDSGPELILAEFEEFSKKPIIKSTVERDLALISIQARDNSFFGDAIKIHDGRVQDWDIRFSEDLPLDIKCNGYDNDFHLNFLNSRLKKLTLETEGTNIYLKIGFNEPYVQVFIDGDDSKLRLRVPEEIGVKLIGHDAAFFEKLGFEETKDGSFVNDFYDTAEGKIDIEIGNNLLSFSLDYY